MIHWTTIAGGIIITVTFYLNIKDLWPIIKQNWKEARDFDQSA